MFWKTYLPAGKSARTGCVLLMASLCASTLLSLSACDKTRQAVRDSDAPRVNLPQDPNLPNLSDPRFAPVVPVLDRSSRSQMPVTLRVSRLDFPASLNLSKALAHAVPATDDQTTALLKGNGLKVVLLPLGEFEDFAKALGDPLNIWRSNLQMAYDGTPLSTTPQISRRVSVDITDPQNPMTFTTDQGWFRLMLAVQKARLGDVQLNITPQHYLPKTSVKVRSAMDKIWDGTLFDMLKTTVTLPNTHLLILCRTDRPTLADYRQQNQTGLFDPEPGENAMIKENFSMGDLLLSYDLWGHPTQMVYVIARAKGR